MNKRGGNKQALRAVSPDITMGPVVTKKVVKEKVKEKPPEEKDNVKNTPDQQPTTSTSASPTTPIPVDTPIFDDSVKIGEELEKVKIVEQPLIANEVNQHQRLQQQQYFHLPEQMEITANEEKVVSEETITNDILPNISYIELQNILNAVNIANTVKTDEAVQEQGGKGKVVEDAVGKNEDNNSTKREDKMKTMSEETKSSSSSKGEEKASTNEESTADGKRRRSTRIKSLDMSRPPRSVVGVVERSSHSNGNHQPVVSPPVSPVVLGPTMVRKPGHIIYDTTDEELTDKLKKFEGIDESRFRTERKVSKESKNMICDCYLSPEEIQRGDIGCNEDCLNRLLMVECGSRCPTGDRCTNKKFQRKQYCTLEVFRTEKKGHGLRTMTPLSAGGFVIEYVGEVLDPRGFHARTKAYAAEKQEHFYFMALKSDAIIDATKKGNCSRFINHSCDPNCETQKWTVNGELRIGFFALRALEAGEEITFDYQFQRYGKKAQQCFCMAEKCRGWIGGEEDEENKEPSSEVTSDLEEEEEVIQTTTTTTTTTPKVKGRPGRPKKKRDENVLPLGDLALEEELAMLERSGLKNRNHTLTLCRLMIRAEDWDVRERILNILTSGDQPCRRLFLDYHGLRLLYGWMSSLPLPTPESQASGLITNDLYHVLFLKALRSLPIPNKTLLQDSKVLPLVNSWSQIPALKLKIVKNELQSTTTTESITKEEVSSLPSSLETIAANINATAAPAQIPVKMEIDESIKTEPVVVSSDTIVEFPTTSTLASFQQQEEETVDLPPIPGLEDESTVTVKVESSEPVISKIENNEIIIPEPSQNTSIEMVEAPIVIDKEEVVPVVVEMEGVVPMEKEVENEKEEYWDFVEGANRLLEDWADLKEVFRIPKKERVEQMKEHEREADIGVTTTSSRESSSSYAYDKDRESKYSKHGSRSKERRVSSMLDSSHGISYRRSYNNSYHSHLTKEQRRSIFAAQVERQEQEQKQRQMQDEMVALHQNRCASLGLDPATTPIVDPSGAYYLDPTTISWKEIDPQDPDLPQELLLLVHASQYPVAPVEPEVMVPEPAEVAFPPWPEGLPPPPPLPPTVLPLGWKMAVDDLGRCYYYDVETRHTQWEPPSPETIHALYAADSSDSEDSEDDSVATAAAEDSTQNLAMVMEKKSRLIARREKRRNSGLVQERIISPRRDDDKPLMSQKQIRARKLQMAEEKMHNKRIKVVIEEESVAVSSCSSSGEVVNSAEETENTDQMEDDAQSSTGEKMETNEAVLDPVMQVVKSSPGKSPISISKKESSEKGGGSSANNSDILETSEESGPKGEAGESDNIENDDERDLVEAAVAELHSDSGPNSPSQSSSQPPSSAPPSALEAGPSHKVKKSSRSSSKHIDKSRSHKKSKSGEKRSSAVRGESAEMTEKKKEKEKKASEEYFRNQIANVIVQYLNPYRKPDCPNGRITSTDDFKHLARKLTHTVTTKEVRHCKNAKTLVVNESVKHKTKEFVKKYMGKFVGDYVHQPE